MHLVPKLLLLFLQLIQYMVGRSCRPGQCCWQQYMIKGAHTAEFFSMCCLFKCSHTVFRLASFYQTHTLSLLQYILNIVGIQELERILEFRVVALKCFCVLCFDLLLNFQPIQFSNFVSLANLHVVSKLRALALFFTKSKLHYSFWNCCSCYFCRSIQS